VRKGGRKAGDGKVKIAVIKDIFLGRMEGKGK